MVNVNWLKVDTMYYELPPREIANWDQFQSHCEELYERFLNTLLDIDDRTTGVTRFMVAYKVLKTSDLNPEFLTAMLSIALSREADRIASTRET